MRTALTGLLLASSALRAAPPDPVFEAMKTELKRSTTLKLNQLETPYFVSYSVDDGHVWSATATLGGLISSNNSRVRIPRLSIRVGDYKFDNTNFSGGGMGGGARYDLRSFPLDDDPLVIRQYLWLATDSAYKGSLQAIARKRAALRSVTLSEQLPDFSPAPKFTLLQDFKPVAFEEKVWTERTRRISAEFNAFPTLRSSLVEFSAVDGLHRFVNTEGTEVREQQDQGSMQIRASAQAADGMIVRDSALFYTRDLSKMFAEADLSKAARSVGETVTKIAAAPLGDNYSGPVLFEGVASSQLMAEVLGRNLHVARKPITAQGGAGQAAATELQGRRGVRIMPESFDVTDDPTLAGFGHEVVDDEGIPEQKVSLVEGGILKDFLRTREPVRGYTQSNGRARLTGGGAIPTNLVITTREKTPIAELKKKMMDLCQQRGLPFGIIVRKMDFPSTASLDEARKMLAGGSGGGTSRPVSMPLYIYRLYPDGREEMIRGLRLRGVNARSLKDILAAGDDNVTFNYLENGVQFALLGYGNSTAEVSVAAPSVLIDDLELTRIDDEMQKLPIAPPPTVASR